MEIRTGRRRRTARWTASTPAADGTLEGSTDLTFDKPVTARYVLVWITGLVPGDDGFSADLAEVAVHAAG